MSKTINICDHIPYDDKPCASIRFLDDGQAIIYDLEEANRGEFLLRAHEVEAMKEIFSGQKTENIPAKI